MSVNNSKTGSNRPGSVVPPAVYRPLAQSATSPAVAQLKPATTVPPPPVYRPSPQSAPRPAASQASSAQAKPSGVRSAPPVYRPQSAVSQPMRSNASNPSSAQKPGFAGATLLPHALSRARIPTIFSPTSRSIQRMEGSSKVKLQPLQGAYAAYFIIIASYCKGGSFIGDYRVEHWLQVAQAVGIAAPETDNHASQPGGEPDGEKAREEQGNFTRWFARNRQQLESVEVDYGGGSKGKSSMRHNQQQQREVQIEKEKEKKQKKKNKGPKAKQLCEESGEHFPKGGQPCRYCGQF